MKPITFILIFGIAGAICTILVVVFTFLQNQLSSYKSNKTLSNTEAIREENKLT